MTDHSPASYVRGARDAIIAENYTDALAHLEKALEGLDPGEDPRPNGLTDTDRANFHTLMEAASNDDVVILHAREKASGHHHALLSIASAVTDSDDTDLIPVARMLDRSATLDYDNPAED